MIASLRALSRGPGAFCCYNYLCGPCAGAASLVSRQTAITPGIARAGDSIPAKGLGKSMNSVYALIYIVAALCCWSQGCSWVSPP